MRRNVKYYNWLCNSALAYKKGALSQDLFLNNVAEYLVWKVENILNPYVSRAIGDIERGYLSGK